MKSNIENQELTTVYLVGSLGKAIGREVWHLDVKSVSEAIRAIDVNTKGALEAYLTGPGAKKNYKIALQKKDNLIDIKDEISNRSGRVTIYIMPTIKGKDKGWQKIVAGVVILALAYFTGGLSLGATGWAGAGGTAASAGTAATAGSLSALGSIAIGLGVGLVLGGITQMLTPTPTGPGDPAEQNGSKIFQGNVGSVIQGSCVPVVYGRALVSPVPVSITVDNDDLSTTSAGANGFVDQTELEGGGVQYGN